MIRCAFLRTVEHYLTHLACGMIHNLNPSHIGGRLMIGGSGHDQYSPEDFGEQITDVLSHDLPDHLCWF